MRTLLAVLLALAAGTVHSHHEVEHRAFAVGVPFQLQARAAACDSLAAALEVTEAHARDGEAAAAAVFEKWSHVPGVGGGHCGWMTARWTILAVLWEGDLPFAGELKHVYVLAATGKGWVGTVLFADMTLDPDIVERGSI